MRWPWVARYSERDILVVVGGGGEGLGFDFAALLEEDFDFGFGFGELLAAGVAELHALFEKLDGFLQGEFGGFKLLDDLFEVGQAGLETEGFLGRFVLLGHGVFIIVAFGISYFPGSFDVFLDEDAELGFDAGEAPGPDAGGGDAFPDGESKPDCGDEGGIGGHHDCVVTGKGRIEVRRRG